MKTQDNKSILIELEDEGWKFSCENFDINIDNGLYLGIKNSYKENQNICVSGMSKDKSEIIKWEINKTIMKKIKTALISVSDKKNLKPLLNSLKQNKIKIISSGGTYKEIKKIKI
jgi:ABC-type xylose transport system substrate-binding protein